MLKVLFKTIAITLLMTVLAGQIAFAESRLYRYDGRTPFVKMMLTMMEAMGVLDKVPNYGGYGMSGYPGSQWSGQNNPYANNLYSRHLYSRNPYLRALALRGMSPGNTNNPLIRSPWLNSPWTQSASNTTSPVWGSPSWGVLPVESYTPYGSRYGSRWSAYDLSGWVNEPWETSTWNPKAEDESSTQSSQSSVPLVQNFNYNVPEETRQKNHLPHNQSPLRKLAPPDRRSSSKAKKHSSLRKKNQEKPCITDFCGLKKPDLNGLWVAQDGEMLGINDKRYLWTNGSSRYLTGRIKVQNEYLLTSVDEHDEIIRFKYKLAGNHLLTLRPDGTMLEFVRMPNNRYRNNY